MGMSHDGRFSGWKNSAGCDYCGGHQAERHNPGRCANCGAAFRVPPVQPPAHAVLAGGNNITLAAGYGISLNPPSYSYLVGSGNDYMTRLQE